jgi:hypothetical protein
LVRPVFFILPSIDKFVGDITVYDRKTAKRFAHVSTIGLIIAPMAMAISQLAQAYEIKAGDTTATVYGTVMLDTAYYSGKNNGDFFSYSTVATDGQRKGDGNIDMNAYRSRFGFTSSTPTSKGPFNMKIEGDFFGTGGTLRLRQAYGEWNHILAGQTWINFGSFIGAMPVINFVGLPGGPVAHRQAQFRVSFDNWHIALENPKGRGGAVDSTDAAHGVTASTSKNRLPDLTVRYENDKGDFQYAISGLARALEYDAKSSTTRTDNWGSDNAIGWGAALAAAYNLTPTITLHGAFTTGKGIGGYINGAPQTTPAYVDESGDLATIRSTGYTLSGTYKIGPGKLGIGYGQVKMDLDAAARTKTFSSGTLDSTSSTFVNYLWSPLKNVTYGVETGYNTAGKVGDDNGSEVSVEASVLYSF